MTRAASACVLVQIAPAGQAAAADHHAARGAVAAAASRPRATGISGGRVVGDHLTQTCRSKASSQMSQKGRNLTVHRDRRERRLWGIFAHPLCGQPPAAARRKRSSSAHLNQRAEGDQFAAGILHPSGRPALRRPSRKSSRCAALPNGRLSRSSEALRTGLRRRNSSKAARAAAALPRWPCAAASTA